MSALSSQIFASYRTLRRGHNRLRANYLTRWEFCAHRAHRLAPRAVMLVMIVAQVLPLAMARISSPKAGFLPHNARPTEVTSNTKIDRN